MKTINLQSLFIAAFLLVAVIAKAQQPDLQYFRTNDKGGLNVFETPKDNDVPFDGVKVRVGGDFALQFQGIEQSGDSITTELGSNFNLPSANFNLDVQLADGMRMHLRTYLSSRHHTEAYVKGGYFQIDNLNWLSDGLASGLMDIMTIRFGMDDINYGDAHFRRSDNARSIYNPFVGNYLMDAFTTEPFAEITVQTSGILGVIGATNGRLNQNVAASDSGMVIYGKLGYDNQLTDDLRVRLTGSIYTSTSGGTRDYLYGGDRAGSRYYGMLEASDFSGRFNPGFSRSTGYLTAFQINPFVKFQGLEFFGVFEVANNGDSDLGGSYTQLGAELLYRFGAEENFYLGGRYNSVSGSDTDAATTVNISRLNVGGGWFLTNNVLTKVEYVNQAYGDGFESTFLQDAGFSGVVIEAVIGF